MAYEFVAGHLVPVGFQKTGGTLLTLNIKSHSLDLTCLLHDVTGYKALGVRARIAGPLDADGRIVLDLDLLEPWYAQDGAVPRIVPSYSGIMAFGVNAAGTKTIQIPMICERLHHAGEVDREIIWDATWKMNSLAGAIVYPAL
jgi:hypothetical protein